jgi:type III pantothenate kinase
VDDHPLFLAIDAGNSRTKLGLFKGNDLLWKFNFGAIADPLGLAEFRQFMQPLVQQTDLPNAVGLCSVVHGAEGIVRDALAVCPGVELFVLKAGMDVGMPNRCEPPESVGLDRLAIALAAREAYGAPVIAVAFGTATTFNVVDREGEFIGGAIAPGLMVGAEALKQAAPSLPSLILSAIEPAIGNTTESALQSGILLGHAEMVDGLITRMKDELGYDARVVATGGNAAWVRHMTHQVKTFDEALTLKGIRLTWEYSKRRQAGSGS